MTRNDVEQLRGDIEQALRAHNAESYHIVIPLDDEQTLTIISANAIDELAKLIVSSRHTFEELTRDMSLQQMSDLSDAIDRVSVTHIDSLDNSTTN